MKGAYVRRLAGATGRTKIASRLTLHFAVFEPSISSSNKVVAIVSYISQKITAFNTVINNTVVRFLSNI